MGRRPTSVTVISVIGIILGTLAILGLLWQALNQFVDIGPPNAMVEKLRADRGYVTFVLASLIVSLLLTVMELVCSIASLRLRPWARKGMMLYAWITVGLMPISVAVTMLYVNPKLVAAIDPTNPIFPYARTYMGFVTACSVPLGLAFPVCILIFFRRTIVVNAFNGIFPADPRNFPVEMDGVPPGPSDSPFP